MGLIYEKRESIAYVIFDRPQAKNALDPQALVDLAQAWTDFEADNAMRVAVVTGRGEVFCSGADLALLIPLLTRARAPETEADHKILEDPLIQQKALLRDPETVTKPIVAAVNGPAIAGGMELLQATDIRIASENAFFALQEPRWGLFPLGGSTVRLPRQIPWAIAMEVLLTGGRLPASEALSYGLVNRVVPCAKVLETAEEIARIICANGPLAVRAIKRSALACSGLPIAEALSKELEYGLPVFRTEDAKEGPRAFKEKRAPRFQGR